MKKRISFMLTLLIALCTMVGVSFIADAEDINTGNCGENVTWQFDADTGVLSITGTGEMEDYSSVSKTPWYAYRNAITSVEISEGIVVVGTNAFREFKSVNSVRLSESVITIGDYAFYNCTGLKNLDLKKVESIGTQAFRGCTGLTSLTIPETVTSCKRQPFENCSNITTVEFEGTRATIPNYICEKITGLETIIWPDGLEAIAHYAFSDCTSLKNVSIPDTVKTIGVRAFASTAITSLDLNNVEKLICNSFYKCTSLETVKIPETLDAVEYATNMFETKIYAPFEGCTNLKTVEFEGTRATIPNYICEKITGLETIIWPDGLEAIAHYAFSECTSLKNVSIPDTVKTIGIRAFASTAITSLDLNNVEKLICNSFYKCTSLETVKIPETLDVVEYATNMFETKIYAPFEGCTNLKTVEFEGTRATIPNYICEKISGLETIIWPDGLEAIPNYAFSGCTALENVSIPDTVKTIGSYAFDGCSNLYSLNLGKTEAIDKYAFRNCKSLAEFEVTETVKAIADYSFEKCISLKELDLSCAETIGSRAFSDCTGLKSVIIPETVNTFGTAPFYGCSNITIVIFEGSREVIPTSICNNMAGLKIINWPKDVETIKNSAFEGCKGLESLVLPDSVKAIGQYAFKDCISLKSIDLNKAETISAYAFRGCTELTELTIPETVNTCGTAPFSDCSNIRAVIFKGSREVIPSSVCSNMTGLNIINWPNDVESIKNSAFEGCKGLESLVLPDSVKAIGQYAFKDCTSLKNIDLNKAETISAYAFRGCTELTELTIPETVNTCGTSPFYGCSNIRAVTFKGTVVPANICGNLKALHTVDMVNGVTTVGKNAFADCTSLEKFIIRSVDCAIPDSAATIPETAAIYGFKGSTAEKYAQKYARKFVEIQLLNSYEDCVNYVRNQMLAKNKYISFIYNGNDLDFEHEKPSIDFINSVFRYDPTKPTQGDYLRWGMSSYRLFVEEGSDGSKYFCVVSTYRTTDEQESEVDLKIAEIISDLNLKSVSDYEKIRLIFGYIVGSENGIVYAEGKDEEIYHTAYNTLINKAGVCDGFALTFYRLANEVGVESRVVVSPALNHAWNIVKLDGNWYYLDATSAKKERQGSEVFYFLRSVLSIPGENGWGEYYPEFDPYNGTKTPFTQDTYPIAERNYRPDGACDHMVLIETGKSGFTCLGTGVAFYYCEECKKEFERELALTNHIDNDENGKCDNCNTKICMHPANRIEYREAKPATCTEDGYSEREICTVCKEDLKEYKIDKANGRHVDENEDRICDNCGESLSFFQVIILRFQAILNKISRAISKLFGKK